jgi:hypothetical protein
MPGLRGERGVIVNTIAQGRPGLSDQPVVTEACVPFALVRKAMGVAGTRLSLRPLHSRGEVCARLGRESAARTRRFAGLRSPHPNVR